MVCLNNCGGSCVARQKHPPTFQKHKLFAVVIASIPCVCNEILILHSIQIANTTVVANVFNVRRCKIASVSFPGIPWCLLSWQNINSTRINIFSGKSYLNCVTIDFYKTTSGQMLVFNRNLDQYNNIDRNTLSFRGNPFEKHIFIPICNHNFHSVLYPKNLW